jgi:argininosuccinate synthase
MSKTVVLAYSGGLDTSAIVPWLKEEHDCEVVAVVGDVGQGAHELDGIEERARRSGARECIVLDLKREFIEDYVFPTLAAGSVYETKYLLGTAVARPVLAGAQARVALEIGADALCHGCTGKGNDQVRFEAAYAAIAPHLEVIAPWRQWSMRSREDLLDYLHQRGIACSASPEKIYSRDANLWHLSHEGGDLEDPATPPGDEVWMMTTAPSAAPDEGQEVTIGFVAGRPCTIDGRPLEPVALVTELNAIAGRHGVGRIDIVENRLVGMKSRGCYETPGGTVLTEALRSLEELVLDRATLRHRQHLGRELADLLYDGKWFTPLREAILAGVGAIASALTGSVTVRLYKGTAVAVGRTAEQSLYSERFATFGGDDVYDQKDAAGFIRLVTLPSRIAAANRAAGAAGGTVEVPGQEVTV